MALLACTTTGQFLPADCKVSMYVESNTLRYIVDLLLIAIQNTLTNWQKQQSCHFQSLPGKILGNFITQIHKILLHVAML